MESAFPLKSLLGNARVQYAHRGLTLRDYFATHAPPPPQWWKLERGEETVATYAEWCFKWADEMLKARGNYS